MAALSLEQKKTIIQKSGKFFLYLNVGLVIVVISIVVIKLILMW